MKHNVMFEFHKKIYTLAIPFGMARVFFGA